MADGNYLGNFNVNPAPYGDTAGFSNDISKYQLAGQNVLSSAQQIAQNQMLQALFSGNYQRQGLLGGLAGMGLGRSSMFGGAGSGRLQQFDTGLGSQIGNAALGLNQTLNQNALGQQQTMGDAQMGALQQSMWQRAQQPSPFDIIGLGVSGLQAMPGLGAGIGMLGKLFG